MLSRWQGKGVRQGGSRGRIIPKLMEERKEEKHKEKKRRVCVRGKTEKSGGRVAG